MFITCPAFLVQSGKVTFWDKNLFTQVYTVYTGLPPDGHVATPAATLPRGAAEGAGEGAPLHRYFVAELLAGGPTLARGATRGARGGGRGGREAAAVLWRKLLPGWGPAGRARAGGWGQRLRSDGSRARVGAPREAGGGGRGLGLMGAPGEENL